MIRGFVSVPDSTGAEPYKEFALNSTETVRFHIQKSTDGVLADFDVSSAALTVYFRAKDSAGNLVINTAMTKVASGTTGVVTANVKFADTDWTADEVADCGVVIVNTGSADGDTPSGYVETIVYGIWQAIIRDGVSS